jgi:hypothetical protein
LANPEIITRWSERRDQSRLRCRIDGSVKVTGWLGREAETLNKEQLLESLPQVTRVLRDRAEWRFTEEKTGSIFCISAR